MQYIREEEARKLGRGFCGWPQMSSGDIQVVKTKESVPRKTAMESAFCFSKVT